MLWTLLGFAFRLIGLAEWFENWHKARQSAKQQQEQANVPITDKEESDFWRHRRH